MYLVIYVVQIAANLPCVCDAAAAVCISQLCLETAVCGQGVREPAAFICRHIPVTDSWD